MLERFKHDLSICRPCLEFVGDIPGSNAITTTSKLTVGDESESVGEGEPNNQKKIVLEEYTFTVTPDDKCNKVAKWIAKNVLPSDQNYGYWQKKVRQDIVVLSNEDFRDFVMFSTEVIARTKIDSKTGTVDKKIGGLWYEEYLPTDSILYSLALTSPIFQEKDTDKGIFLLTAQEKVQQRDESEKVMEFFEDGLPGVIQLGGNATIGKGIVRTRVYGN